MDKSNNLFDKSKETLETQSKYKIKEPITPDTSFIKKTSKLSAVCGKVLDTIRKYLKWFKGKNTTQKNFGSSQNPAISVSSQNNISLYIND